MITNRRLGSFLLALVGVLAAACASDAPGEGQPSPSASPSSTAPSAPAAGEEPANGTVEIEERTETGLGDVEIDAAWPEGEPARPSGSVGFSRYVYAQVGDTVLPFLLEGPAREQVRCQDVDLPCSYLELSALAESGDPIPAELGLDRAELVELVGQLDALSETLLALTTIDDACAAGYEPYTTQWPNMGVHMRNPDHLVDGTLDPRRPHAVMFARPGGEQLGRDELGGCEGGRWTGDPDGFEVVGGVFYLPLTAEHPAGFAGPIDNWHMHFNSCGGSSASGVTPVSPEECEDDGGTFFVVDPRWMIHAYVVPEYDNQAGVFAMWNPTVSPVVDPVTIADDRDQLSLDGAVTWSIRDFALADLEAEVGQSIVFANSDAAPHTITSTDGLFDSGTFGTGGTYELSFDEPGSYSFFCTLHPSMAATIDVGG